MQPRALELLPELPKAAYDPLFAAAGFTAEKSFNGIIADDPRSLLAGTTAILTPPFLAPALRELAGYYDQVSSNYKAGWPAKDKAKHLFLWLVPGLAEQQSGRPHDNEVAALYGFIFNCPVPANLARLRNKTRTEGR